MPRPKLIDTEQSELPRGSFGRPQGYAPTVGGNVGATLAVAQLIAVALAVAHSFLGDHKRRMTFYRKGRLAVAHSFLGDRKGTPLRSGNPRGCPTCYHH